MTSLDCHYMMRLGYGKVKITETKKSFFELKKKHSPVVVENQLEAAAGGVDNEAWGKF